MTCDGYQELISMMFDSELGDHHFSPLFQHLSTCDQCSRFFQAGLSLRSSFATTKPIIAPRRLDERIERIAFGRPIVMRHSVVETLWRTRISFPLPAAASIAILLVIGSLLLFPAVFEEHSTPITISSESLYNPPSSVIPEMRPPLLPDENKGR